MREAKSKKETIMKIILKNIKDVVQLIIFAVAIIIAIILSVQCPVDGAEYTNDEIADAIYKSEGADLATYPYGIRSVKCEGLTECRQVCLNTIRNNRKRYVDYGHKKYDTYLEFLASRYAPVNAPNDPQELNKNWLKNVKWFLENR